MRSRARRGEEEDDINMTPMLDIVFIMLIFFIVTASFIKETGIDLQRPAPSQDKKQDQSKTTTILISINEEGQVWVGNRIVDVRAVRANIERLTAQNSDLKAVVINVDFESKNEVLIHVLDAAKQAGFENVSITSG